VTQARVLISTLPQIVRCSAERSAFDADWGGKRRADSQTLCHMKHGVLQSYDSDHFLAADNAEAIPMATERREAALLVTSSPMPLLLSAPRGR
jgi:hypothetical protein